MQSKDKLRGHCYRMQLLSGACADSLNSLASIATCYATSLMKAAASWYLACLIWSVVISKSDAC